MEITLGPKLRALLTGELPPHLTEGSDLDSEVPDSCRRGGQILAVTNLRPEFPGTAVELALPGAAGSWGYVHDSGLW
jgi:hypothetical protein